MRLYGVSYWTTVPEAHHDDSVGQTQRLLDIVRDEDHCLPERALDADQFVLQVGAGDGVDGAERFVHQHHFGIGRHGTCDANPLLLPAGELPRIALPVLVRRQHRPGRAARRCAREFVRASQPSSFGTTAMFCATVICGKSPTCWMT